MGVLEVPDIPAGIVMSELRRQAWELAYHGQAFVDSDLEAEHTVNLTFVAQELRSRANLLRDAAAMLEDRNKLLEDTAVGLERFLKIMNVVDQYLSRKDQLSSPLHILSRIREIIGGGDGR